MSLTDFEISCRDNQNKILPILQEIIDSVTTVMLTDFPDPYYLPIIESQQNFLEHMKATFPLDGSSDVQKYREILENLKKESVIAFYYNRISQNRVESRLIFEGTNPKESEAAAYNSKSLYEFYAPFALLSYGEDLRFFFEMRKTLLNLNYSSMSYLDFLIMILTYVNPILIKLHFYKISWVKAFLNEISSSLNENNSNSHYTKLLANLESSPKLLSEAVEMSNIFTNNFNQYLVKEILEMDQPNNYSNILAHINDDAYKIAKNYNMWNNYFQNFNYDPQYDMELSRFINMDLLFNDRQDLQQNPVISNYMQRKGEIYSLCYDFKDSCKYTSTVTPVALDFYSNKIQKKKLSRSELNLFVSIEGFMSCAENDEERKAQLLKVVNIMKNTQEGVFQPFYYNYLELRSKQLESEVSDDEKDELFSLKMKMYDLLNENETPQINIMKKCDHLMATFGALTLFD
jgi:hypothetical protein